MVAIITQKRKDKDYLRRRKISSASRKLRDRREASTRKSLSSFYVRLEKTVLQRARKVGKTAVVVEELFRASEYQEQFIRLLLPQINRTVFTGLQFEADYIKTLSVDQSYRGIPTIDQIEGPEIPPVPEDVILPPGIHVDLPRPLQRKIASFLQERAVGVWSKVSPTIRKKLEREIMKSLRDGEPFKVLEERLKKTLRGLKRVQPMAIARTETTLAMGKGGQWEREELDIPSKEWVSTIDEYNRGADLKSNFDHLAPDGQTVANDEPFIVSGERIPTPGDGSMGASAGNLIQCRCGAIASMRAVQKRRRR